MDFASTGVKCCETTRGTHSMTANVSPLYRLPDGYELLPTGALIAPGDILLHVPSASEVKMTGNIRRTWVVITRPMPADTVQSDMIMARHFSSGFQIEVPVCGAMACS
jgi:hypothetical protein